MLERIAEELEMNGATTKIVGNTVVGQEDYIGSFIVTVYEDESILFSIEDDLRIPLSGLTEFVQYLEFINEKKRFYGSMQ